MKEIFVSSTFRDMQYERDILQKEVLPHLRNFAAQYGNTVRLCDLRWGINTTDLDSDEGSQKILSVCMETIDRCRPYMIVLLGDRYGWVPDEPILKKATKRAGLSGFHKQSVTALEIEYGMLQKTNGLTKSLFYFRKPLEGLDVSDCESYASESDESAHALKSLKQKIKADPNAKVYEYTGNWDASLKQVTGLEKFSERVLEDLTRLLIEEWGDPRPLTPYEADVLLFDGNLREKADVFIARQEQLSAVRNQLNARQNHLVLIKGEPGSGKSTLVAALWQSLQNAKVIPFLCGASATSATARGLLIHFINALSAAPPQGLSDLDEIKLRNLLTELLAVQSKDRPVVLLVDALDQLSRDLFAQRMSWLPTTLPERGYIVISMRDTYPLPPALPLETGIYSITLPALNVLDRQEVIHSILNQNQKELDRGILNAISLKEGAKSPLYLRMLLQRILMLDHEDFSRIQDYGGDMQAINQYLSRFVKDAPESLDTLCSQIINEAGERINDALCRCATRLLAFAKRGLRIADLEGIFLMEGEPWSALDFERLVLYMKPFFIERENGCLAFSHDSIRHGFRADALHTAPQQAVHESILRWLLHLLPDDAVVLAEILYQFRGARQHTGAIRFITKVDQTSKALLAQELRLLSLEDDGEWLTQLAQSEPVAGWLAFSCGFLIQAFDKSTHEQSILLTYFTILRECFANEVELAELDNALATVNSALGRFQAADALWSDAVGKLSGSQKDEAMLAHAELLLRMGEYTRAHCVLSPLLASGHAQRARALLANADILIAENQFVDAHIAFIEAFDCILPDASYYVPALERFAELLVNLGDPFGAADKLKDVLSIRRNAYANDDSIESVRAYGRAYLSCGSCLLEIQSNAPDVLLFNSEAEALLKRVYMTLKTSDALLDWIRAMNGKGLGLQHSGHPTEAVQIMTEAVNAAGRAHASVQTSESLLVLTRSKFNLGSLLTFKDSMQAGMQLFEEAKNLLQSALDKEWDHAIAHLLAELLHTQTFPYEKMGQYKPSIALLTDGIAMCERLITDVPSYKAYFLYFHMLMRLTQTYEHCGNLDKMRETRERSILALQRYVSQYYSRYFLIMLTKTGELALADEQRNKNILSPGEVIHLLNLSAIGLSARDRLLKTRYDSITDLDTLRAIIDHHLIMDLQEENKRRPGFLSREDMDDLGHRLDDIVHSVMSPDGMQQSGMKRLKQLSMEDISAEAQGIAESMLAMRYLTGDRVEKNEATAIRWLKRAAAKDNQLANLQLGTIEEREGLLEPAIAYYRAAAENANPESMYRLASCYRKLPDSTLHSLKAQFWYHLSAQKKYIPAYKALEECYRLDGWCGDGPTPRFAELYHSIAQRAANAEV